jgi:hypothetical protein
VEGGEGKKEGREKEGSLLGWSFWWLLVEFRRISVRGGGT